MTRGISRRRFVRSAGSAGLALGAAGIIGAPYVARGAQPTKLVTGTLAGGWSHIVNELLIEKDFAPKHDLGFEVFNTYNAVQQYYADIITGNIEIGVGAWDFFAKVYGERQAPVQLIGICTTGTLAGYYAGPNGPRSLADLKGKTLAAMEVSGTYLMGRTWARLFDDIEFGKDVTVQNAPNPPAVLTLVAANRADAALAWEHMLSAFLTRVPGSEVFLNLNDQYHKHTNRDMPYFCVAINKERMARHPPGTIAKAVGAYADMFRWIDQNTDGFASYAPRVNLDEAVIKKAVTSGRMKFAMRSMAEEKYRAEVIYCAKLMKEAGTVPEIDDGLFAA